MMKQYKTKYNTKYLNNNNVIYKMVGNVEIIVGIVKNKTNCQ